MLINPSVPASTPTHTQGTTLQQRYPRPLRIVVRLHLKADAIETTRQGHHRHSTRSPRIAYANDTTMQRWGMLFYFEAPQPSVDYLIYKGGPRPRVDRLTYKGGPHDVAALPRVLLPPHPHQPPQTNATTAAFTNDTATKLQTLRPPDLSPRQHPSYRLRRYATSPLPKRLTS